MGWDYFSDHLETALIDDNLKETKGESLYIKNKNNEENNSLEKSNFKIFSSIQKENNGEYHWIIEDSSKHTSHFNHSKNKKRVFFTFKSDQEKKMD